MALSFVDEVGSPLPPGVKVSVYSITNGFQGPLIGQGYTNFGGIIGIALPPGTTNEYIAFFSGFAAPKNPLSFGPSGLQAYYDLGYEYDQGWTYDGSLIVCSNYRSPALTGLQYATAACLLQPSLWYPPPALNVGGILHALLRGMTAGIAAEDLNAQAILEMLRIQTCQGGEIDSWALDMIGPLFQRFDGETDAGYYGRLGLMIGRPRCTINAIQAMVQGFYNYLEGQPGIPTSGQLVFDTAGGYNATGAFNTNPPAMAPAAPGTAIYVWDGMTQPGLATIFGVGANQFVIQVGALVVSQAQLLAMNTVGGFDTSGAFNTNPNDQVLPTPSPLPPDARLGEIIQIISKAGGTQPLYIYGPSLQE